MCGVTGFTEKRMPCAPARYGTANPVTRHLLAGHVPDGSRPAGHHAEGGKQLAHAGDVGGIRHRDRTERRSRLRFMGRRPRPLGARCFRVRRRTDGISESKKVARAQRQRLVQPRALVPERIDKRPLLQVRQKAEQLTDVEAGGHRHFAQPDGAGPAARLHQGCVPAVSVRYGCQIHSALRVRKGTPGRRYRMLNSVPRAPETGQINKSQIAPRTGSQKLGKKRNVLKIIRCQKTRAPDAPQTHRK